MLTRRNLLKLLPIALLPFAGPPSAMGQGLSTDESHAARAVPQACDTIVDKHFVISLDMSGSIDRFEARDMQRAWKDALLEKFSQESENKSTYLVSLLSFHNGVKHWTDRFIRTSQDAEKFVYEYLWDKDENDFRPLKDFFWRGNTNIHAVLEHLHGVFNEQAACGLTVASRDIVFMADGYQQRFVEDRVLVEARQKLEQDFGASVHVIAVGRLEKTIGRDGVPYGRSERFGTDQEASLRGLLCTPQGEKRTVTETFGNRTYRHDVEILPGQFERSEDFKGLVPLIDSILSLDRN